MGESCRLCSGSLVCHGECGRSHASYENGKTTNVPAVMRAKAAFKRPLSHKQGRRSFREEKHNFILRCFKYKECMKFVPDLDKPLRPDGRTACYCGEVEDKHYNYENMVNNHDHKWSESEDIKIIGPTNAFGQIAFSDSLTQKPTEFVRISDEDVLKDVMELIKNYWRMMEPEKPSLCISVIGGAKNFLLEGHKKDVFYSGLLQAAHSTKAWIVTSGLNLGIVRVVGDALQDQSLYFDKWKTSGSLRCLGIAPWGYVLNREALISEDHNTPIRYVVSDFIAKCCPVSLNQNHTHYIFVDEGRRLRYGGSKSAEFRAKLEKQIAVPTEKGGFGIPVVLVIVEGGHDVFIDARNSIKEHVPVVICSGTGRAADILTLAVNYRLNYGGIFQGFSTDETEELKCKLLPVCDSPSKADDAIKMIEFIVKNTQLITTFDMNQSDDFDLAILSALIKVSSNVEKQLELAFTWERSDIAHEKILRQGEQIKLETLEHFMLKALKSDKLEFVKILLRNGVSMKKFLTVDRLRELYNDSDRRDGFVKCLTKNNLFLPSKSIVYGNVIRYSDCNTKRSPDHGNTKPTSVIIPVTAVDDFDSEGQNMCLSHDRIRLPTINKLLNRMLGSFENCLYDFDRENTECYSNKWTCNEIFLSPFQELFLWAVLHQRQQMALYFWECSDNPLILALIGCCLYSNMIESLPAYDTETRALYESYVTEFERIAVRLLDLCYETDEKLTLILLERDINVWGPFNCIRLAAQSVRRKFISSTACQDSLYYAWHRGIRVNIFILLCTLICPFLLFSNRLLQWDNALTNTNASPNQNESSCSQNTYTDKSNSCHHNPKRFTLCDRIRWKSRTFYSAPRTKFAFNALIYVLFVLYFSYTLLFETLPNKISTHELVVITYFGAMLIDLVRQIVKSYHGRSEQFHSRWNHYYWNKSDLLLVGLASLSALLRIGMSRTFLYAKSLYVITLVGCYLRIYGLYSHHPRLGPKLVMIRSMLIELLMFIFILVIVLVGYGVSQQVLLYPYRANFTWTTVRDVFVYPYWNLFGELMLEYAFAEKDGCTNGTANSEDCPTFNFLCPLFLAVYLMIAAILLMNLLIAIFSNVFEKIEENSIELWKFNILSMVFEYSHRPVLPVPFSAMIAISELILYCFHVKPILSKIKHVVNRITSIGHSTTAENVNGETLSLTLVNSLNSSEECTAECYSTSRLVPDYITLTPGIVDCNCNYIDQCFNAKQLENYCKRNLLKKIQ